MSEIKTREELESAFASGKIPSAADYSNIFSSFVHKNDESSSGGGGTSGGAFPVTVYPIEIDISMPDTGRAEHVELANVDDLLSLYPTVGLNNMQIGLLKLNITGADFNLENSVFVNILSIQPLMRFMFTDVSSLEPDTEPAFTTPEGHPVGFLAASEGAGTTVVIEAVSSSYHIVGIPGVYVPGF